MKYIYTGSYICGKSEVIFWYNKNLSEKDDNFFEIELIYTSKISKEAFISQMHGGQPFSEDKLISKQRVSDV